MLFSQQILDFYDQFKSLEYPLPRGIKWLNPYLESAEQIMEVFYKKFYADEKERKIILGINPGRKGAAITGIPFTDSVQLASSLKIEIPTAYTYEPSADFFHSMVQAYGGAELFYRDYYVSSVCPLGFIKKNEKGNWVNFNYYDSSALLKRVQKFIFNAMRQQLQLPIQTEKAFCLGSGKNYKQLKKWNDQKGWFNEIVPLPHPRYVIQYRRKEIDSYIDLYLESLVN